MLILYFEKVSIFHVISFIGPRERISDGGKMVALKISLIRKKLRHEFFSQSKLPVPDLDFFILLYIFCFGSTALEIRLIYFYNFTDVISLNSLNYIHIQYYQNN